MQAPLDIQLIRPDELSDEDAAAWRQSQLASERLRAPTLSLDYVRLLARSRPEVRVAAWSGRGTTAFLGVHPNADRWDAAGLLFNDRQALIRAADAPDDATLLKAAPALHAGSWLPDERSADAPIGCAADIGYAIDLSNGEDAYLASRAREAGDHLKKIARRRRALEAELGPVRLVWPDPDARAIKTLLDWKSAQFRRTGRHDILTSRWLRAFIDEAVVGEPDCRADLATLRAGDRVIAAELGFTGLGVNQSWLAAYDPALGRYSPGTLLLHLIATSALSRGIDRIDLGSGHHDYKRYFANTSYVVWSGRITQTSERIGARSMTRLSNWIVRAGLSNAAVPARIQRRYAVIAACEPTIVGRARGVLAALPRLADRT